MTERSLVFRVSVAGQADFARDMGSLNALIRKTGNEEIALARAVGERKKGLRTEEQKHNEALLRMQIALEKARARDSVREAEKAEKDKAKAAAAGEKERARIGQSAAQEGIRAKLEEQRAFDKSEREKTRIVQREARLRQREEDNVRRSRERAEATTSRQIVQQRQAAVRQAQREEYQASRDRMFDHKRLYRGIGTGIADGAYGAVGAAYGTAARISRSVMGATGFDQAFDVGDIVSERMYASKLMRSVAIEARTAGSAFGSNGFSERDALTKVAGVARATGISQRDLLGAIDAASEKGSGADAVTNLDRIAMQATAMGTDATTIAKMRSQMKVSSKVTGREMNDDEIDAFMAKMHFIGKTGVFRAEDVAAQSESLMSQWAKSGGDFNGQATQYLAFINEARKSTGSAAMARTSINAVQDAILKKEGKLNQFGIKTRNGDGSERNFIDIVEDTIGKTGGKGDFFNKVFDPSRSGKAISTLVTAYQSAEIAKKGTGRAAMDRLLSGDESLKDATVGEMQKDAALRMEDAGTRIRKSVETIRQSIGEQLAPVLEKLAANAPVIAEKFGSVLKWVTENPGTAAAGFVGASALKGAAPSLGKAALRFAGDSIANVLPGFGGRALGQAMASSGSTPVYVTGAAPGALGGGGMGGLPLGGAALAGPAMSILLPVIAAAVISYMAADYMAKRGIDIPAPDLSTPKTSGQQATAAIDAYQRGVGDKITNELVNGDADPLERGLLADMLGKGDKHPDVERLITTKSQAIGGKGMGEAGRSADRILAQVLGPQSREAARALDLADSPLGKIVTQNDAAAGNGIGVMTQGVKANVNIDKFAVDLQKASTGLDLFVRKLGVASATASAVKNPPVK